MGERSSIDQLLARLAGVKRNGPGRWMARCPAHADRQPSLSIRELEDGRTLLHCFGACSVDDVLGAVGMDVADLFPPKPTSHAPAVRKPWRAADVIAALEYELLVAWIFLADIEAGKTPTDRARAGIARDRIARLMEELRHAA